MTKQYIGDGVYVEIENDMLKLTTEREHGTHVIYMEPGVIDALNRYYQAWIEDKHETPASTPKS